jgi:hypothetical protein
VIACWLKYPLSLHGWETLPMMRKGTRGHQNAGVQQYHFQILRQDSKKTMTLASEVEEGLDLVVKPWAMVVMEQL